MKTLIHSLALAFTLLAIVGRPQAQQSSTSPNQIPEHLQDLPDAKTHTPQPSGELQSLTKALAGTWSVKVTFEPNSTMPNGFTGSGQEVWRPGPGGFTLVDEEQLPTPDGEIFLLGIIWWDSTSKSLHGMECNNQFPFTCDLKGGLNDVSMTWDGAVFTIDEIEHSADGKKSMWHETWSDISPTSFTQIGEIGPLGGPYKRFLTVRGTKVAGNGK